MALVLAVIPGAAGLWWVWSWLAPGPVARGVAAYNRGDWNEASRLAQQRLAIAKDDRRALRLLRGRRFAWAASPWRGRSTTALTRPTWRPRITACWAWPGTSPESPSRPRRCCAQALRADPDHAESLYLLALAAFQRGWVSRRPGPPSGSSGGRAGSAGRLLLGMIDAGDNDPTGAAAALR